VRRREAVGGGQPELTELTGSPVSHRLLRKRRPAGSAPYDRGSRSGIGCRLTHLSCPLSIQIEKGQGSMTDPASSVLDLSGCSGQAHPPGSYDGGKIGSTLRSTILPAGERNMLFGVIVTRPIAGWGRIVRGRRDDQEFGNRGRRLEEQVATKGTKEHKNTKTEEQKNTKQWKSMGSGFAAWGPSVLVWLDEKRSSAAPRSASCVVPFSEVFQAHPRIVIGHP
jgi:hypothetical protein